MNAGREVGMDRGVSVCGEESFLISDFSLPLPERFHLILRPTHRSMLAVGSVYVSVCQV